MPTAKKTMVKSNLSFPMVAASAMTFMCAQNSSIYSHALVTHSRSFKLHAFDLSNKSSRQFSTARQASVIDEMPISSDVPKNLNSKVVATADFYSFIPSPNNQSGIMTIKLREEDCIPREIQAAKGDVLTADNKQSSLESGMFANVSPMVKAAKKSIEGEDFIGKTVVFPHGRTGTVIAQRPPIAFVICDFGIYDSEGNVEDRTISILGTRTTIPIANHLFGSIIDCYGNPISSSTTPVAAASDTSTINRAIFAPIPKVSDIALINSPLLTGTAMVDALSPIGKGQNMLVIGQETGVGQRDLVIGAIKTQVKSTNGGAKCVYAITSKDSNTRNQILEQLNEAGVLEDIVVVCTRDHPCAEEEGVEAVHGAEAIAVAAAACSIGEGLAFATGVDTFVVVDDIDQHKMFWDWTTRILIDIYGLNAVVMDDTNGGASSEMRGFYSSLIQRAVQFNEKNGGGSMTLSLLTNLQGQFGGGDDESTVFSVDDFAESSEKVRQRVSMLVNKNIPLTPQNLRKIQIPLPVASESEKKRRLALQHIDDLISMSDGQIWLDENLYNKGQRPAVDAQRSITRVGIGADTNSRADAPALRSLAGGLRFDFAQADSLDGAGTNSGADKQIMKKKAYLLAMHQGPGEERTLSDNCVAMMAASMRLLDSAIRDGHIAGTREGQATIQALIEHVRKVAPDAMAEIDTTLDMSQSVKKVL
eukprot:CAMPEP_0176498748 /NCGR_PEP_ID=MMETSP0200_2-20121128/12508_1 /TAXON_ID=947934 /ORGANISM="Chaetoceros sp., Strain GSL56" /LENGTH=702 /DNA_ID=CAMNT_0017897019 /DNA_START=181 /DNA_END=2286 /DNA_ORIENTATION=-